MFKKQMDNKGQISAEYLLLMVIIILILSSVTIPLASKSIDASNDVSQASDAKVAVQSIADAANVVYANGPGAKRVVDIYIPQGTTTFIRSGYNVNSTVKLSNGTKTVSATTQYPLYTYTTPPSPGWHKIQVEWIPGENNIKARLLS